MGGGVGVGCHGSHRIVRGDSRVAMPECSIGLVPDVGGTLLLARAPGRLGERLALTAHRMGPGDAIHAGFADYHVPEGWKALLAELCETGDPAAVDRAAGPPPPSALAAEAAFTERHFGGASLRDVVASLRADGQRAGEGRPRGHRGVLPPLGRLRARARPSGAGLRGH